MSQSDDSRRTLRIRRLVRGVLGFKVDGALHADDYRQVLLPAVEAAIQRGEKVRIVLVFEGFDRLSGGALWQDLKLGVEHLTHWERIALVTDIDWMIHLTALFGWMTPGELKRFPLAEREAAIAWVAAGD
jgi:SpoIIAA-like